MERLQFLEHEFVDEIAARGAGKDGRSNRIGVRHRDGADRDATQIPGGDRAFAVADDLHFAVIIDLGDRGVRRGVFGPARHVFGVTVAEVGAHEQLLVCARCEDGVLRQNLEVIDAGVVRFRSGRAGGNPFRQDPVFQRTDIESFAAFVRDGGCRFQQQQTAARIGGDNPASERVAREREEVAFIIIAAE